MTRKHFEAIAHALRIERPAMDGEFPPYDALETWQRVVRNIASVCASTNGAFDRERFYRAAGYER